MISMYVRWLLATVLVLSTGIVASAAYAERNDLERDVQGYATAACLIAQDSDYLKKQGDGWASNIIQRGRGDVEILRELAAVVMTEAASGQMATMMDETQPMATMALPVQFCAELIDAPVVSQAIARAIAQLSITYGLPKH